MQSLTLGKDEGVCLDRLVIDRVVLETELHFLLG